MVAHASQKKGRGFPDIRAGSSTLVSSPNAVQAFFAKLARGHLQRGVFRSLVDLQTAIDHYLADYNAHSKPFIWSANPNTIITAASGGHQTSKSIH